MSIPDYQTLMLPVLKIGATAEQRVLAVIDPIADQFGLTADDREELLPSGKQRVLHNRIHWAKFYLTKAGLLNAPGRGRFVATDLGKSLLATAPSKIDLETLLRYPEFKRFYKGEAAEASPSELNVKTTVSATTPEEDIERAYQRIDAALRAELIGRILANSPTFFEDLIVSVLVAMGYGGSHRDAAKRLGRSGDGGVDGIINQDRLGLERVYVQAKRYNSAVTVGRPEVQSFVGSLVGLGATKGVFVTTSDFSTQANEYVKHLSQRIVLINGKELTELMIEHQVGVRTTRSIELKRIDEDFFSED